jgi:hypothetical protein
MQKNNKKNFVINTSLQGNSNIKPINKNYKNSSQDKNINKNIKQVQKVKDNNNYPNTNKVKIPVTKEDFKQS